jgi:hypothetical protein
MTPTEIRDLLLAACPELTWVVDGEFVLAEKTGVRAWSSHAWLSQDPITPSIVLGREVGDILSVEGVPLWQFADYVDDLLTQEEIDAIPGADRIGPRVALAAACDRCNTCRAVVVDTERRLSEARRELRQAEWDVGHAEARLARFDAKRLEVMT